MEESTEPLIDDGAPTEDNMYAHKPLKEADEIRLLHLEPRGSSVRCVIRHLKISQNPQYEALSYMWGSADSTKIIYLNGRRFRIRDNLYSALSHLQADNAGGNRVLWIDALCINQDDVKERNHQVAQMVKIYSQAQRVVVWLGEPDDTSRLALHSLVNSGFMKDLAVNNVNLKTWEREINAIKSLCGRPYWERLWIIQENILASTVLVQCGNDFAEWDQILTFFDHVENISRTDRGFGTRRAFVADLRVAIFARLCRDWMFRADQATRSPIYDLCLRYGKAKCQDPRDKFYGLLGIASECCRMAVPIDYTLSRYQICGMVLQHHMVAHMYDISQPPNGLDTSNWNRGSIIKSSQFFHLAVGITRKDAPRRPTSGEGDDKVAHSDNVNLSRHFVVISQDSASDINGINKRTEKQKNGTAASTTGVRSGYLAKNTWQSWLNLKKAFSTCRRNKVRRPIISAPRSRSFQPHYPLLDSKYPIQVAGTVSRIVYLSPQWINSANDGWSNWSFLASLRSGFHRDMMDKVRNLSRGVMSRELDLVCADSEEGIQVDLPLDLHLDKSLSRSTMLANHGLFEMPDLVIQLHTLWNRICKSVLQNWGNIRPDAIFDGVRFAIEENGLGFCVPLETQVDDLICLFPQSDAVAILRRTADGKRATLVGRGVGMLKSSPVDNKALLPQWENNKDIKSSPVQLNLNVHALQLLTRASDVTRFLHSQE